MSKLNIFGGMGFIGSEFCKVNENNVIVNAKHDYEVYSGDIVYFISTTTNYNVYTDNTLDLQTNLIVLMKILQNYKDYVYNNPNQKCCFNYISSWIVYGKDSGFGSESYGISEEEYCDPKGFYSITKRCAEQLLISYCNTFDLNYRILRLSNVVGKSDKKVSKQRNVLQFILNEMKENNTVEIYDSGISHRDYIDVRDCVSAINLSVNVGELNTIYNIGNGIAIPFLEIIEYAHKKLNSKSKIEIIEPKRFYKKVEFSRSFYMNINKIKSLGYSPKYTIWDTVDEILENASSS